MGIWLGHDARPTLIILVLLHLVNHKVIRGILLQKPPNPDKPEIPMTKELLKEPGARIQESE
jgi:hypothetical protein